MMPNAELTGAERTARKRCRRSVRVQRGVRRRSANEVVVVHGRTWTAVASRKGRERHWELALG